MDKVDTICCTDHKFMFWMMICWMKSKCIYEVACDIADVLFTIFVKALNVLFYHWLMLWSPSFILGTRCHLPVLLLLVYCSSTTVWSTGTTLVLCQDKYPCTIGTVLYNMYQYITRNIIQYTTIIIVRTVLEYSTRSRVLGVEDPGWYFWNLR